MSSRTRTVFPSLLLALSGALLVGLLIWLATGGRKPVHQLEPNPPATNTGTVSPISGAISQITNQTTAPSFSKRLVDMTDSERAKLEKDFNQRYMPAVENWFAAYSNRVPFSLSNFTLDKFHSRLGDYMYTFMIGDITFTIQDNPKLGTKVSYLMTRKAALDLNQVPSSGFVPDLRMPVSREEVIRMVKADSGVEFKPNEVVMNPTAAACNLNGGVFVEIIPTGADPNNALNSKISMVFDSDGKLVNYERNPFF